jgi:hypothetical protein
MISRYKIYPELNFGIAKLEPGIKSYEELSQLAKDFREDQDFSKVFYQLTDMRGCIFDFNITKISSMISFIEGSQEFDNQKIGVYIIDKPLETAYVQMYQDTIKYKRDFCSTVEKSYSLLNLKISFDEFKKLINI